MRSVPGGGLRSHERRGAAGMSLLELTVIILALLMLITIMFFGARAWKRGSDRALCLMQIENVQKAVRSYSNLYGFSPGANAPNLQSQIIGFGRFIELTPVCPTGSEYQFGATYGINTIPPMGALYMECPLAVSDSHVPNVTADW